LCVHRRAYYAGKKPKHSTPESENWRKELLTSVNRAGMRHACFLAIVASAIALYLGPLTALGQLSFSPHEHYSHTLLVPFISAYLIYINRETIFSRTAWLVPAGIAGFAVAGIVWFAGSKFALESQDDGLALTMATFVLVCVSAFVLCYGRRAATKALFPLCLLALMVPLPTHVVNNIVYLLQSGSAEVAHAGFKLFNVPVYRDGFSFSLPGVTVVVAEECSGIRSSMALLITALVGGYLFVQSGVNRWILCLSVIPLAMLKNGLRIVTLTILAAYVNPSFLTGRLHRQGGFVFFLIALGLLFLEMRLLERYRERRTGAAVATAN
jgi:exosortase